VHGRTGQIGYAPSCIGGPQNVSVINQGTILADVAAGIISIRGQSFVNQGTVQALNGGNLSIDNIADAAGLLISGGGTLTLSGVWQNTGALSINNSTFTLSGTWTNAGAINFTNSILNLGGSFGPANLGTLNRSGGTLNLTSALDMGGGAFNLDATTGSWVLNGGTLRNAVVNASGGAQLVSISGTLDGVTINGNLDLTAGSGVSVTIVNGLVLNGTATLGNQTTWGYLNFNGSQTLGGNGTVVFGNSGCNAIRLASAATTLTLGPNITVHGRTGQIGYAPSCIGGPQNVSVINQGAILADVNGGTITIRAQPFTNTGTTNHLNGGILLINP